MIITFEEHAEYIRSLEAELENNRDNRARVLALYKQIDEACDAYAIARGKAR